MTWSSTVPEQSIVSNFLWHVARDSLLKAGDVRWRKSLPEWVCEREPIHIDREPLATSRCKLQTPCQRKTRWGTSLPLCFQSKWISCHMLWSIFSVRRSAPVYLSIYIHTYTYTYTYICIFTHIYILYYTKLYIARRYNIYIGIHGIICGVTAAGGDACGVTRGPAAIWRASTIP
jgi:hypothetical protein